MDKLKTKILLISLLLILMFSVQSVAAATDSDGNLTSESIDLSICDNTDDVSSDELSNNQADVLSVSNELDVLGVDEASYSNLSDEIAVGGNVELQHDYYRCYGGESTIGINGDNRIIDGKGAVIDMAGSTIQAFYVGGSGITIKNLTIKNANYNNQGLGGAIVFSSSGTVENCNFINNSASLGGGAVYFFGFAEGTVENCNFINNSAILEGGAICFENTGTVKNCNFTNNTATNGDGGAIYFWDEGNVTNCNFTDNVAGLNGGAIAMGSYSIQNCNFINNNADNGGAVYFFNKCTVTNCNFTNNSATSNGGAVFFVMECTVTNCNFTNNSATNSGTVYFYDKGTVEYCNFTNNSATNSGAVYFSDKGMVEYCNFTNNSATNIGGAIDFGGIGTVTNCNFTNNTATNGGGGAVFFSDEGTVEYCNFANNTANEKGGAIWFIGIGTVTNCNFTGNKVTGSYGGGAISFYSNWTVEYCNFTNNAATNGGGGAISSILPGTVTNCNFTGNNATEGSAIYYFFPDRFTETFSNSCFLNNRANAEELQVIKNDNNITVIFTGYDNLLNAIYSNTDISFSNVTYWGANGIANTGSSTPDRFENEVGQNITVTVLINGALVLNAVKVTDENGMVVLDISAGDNYYISARHDTDSYYTEAETINSTMKFNVNVTSQTTTNKTVNITAKSNIPNEIIKGKLLFILPNSEEISANYGGNGTWWALHTFDDYGVYEVNALYTGLDNVTVNNGTVTISKFNSTISAENKTVTYPGDIVLVTSGENCTGINKSSVVIRSPDGTAADANVIVDGFSLTISGLCAGNYTVYYNNTVNSDWNGAGNFTGITVLKANSSVSAGDVEVTYGKPIEVVVSSENATSVSYKVIDTGGVVKDGGVNVGDNITGLDLAVGDYIVNLTTVVNGNYSSSNYTSKITVKTAKSSVTAEDVVASFGDAVSILVSSANATEISYSIIDFTDKAIVNGTVKPDEAISVSDLAAGDYTVSLTTVVDTNHTSVSSSSKLHIRHVVSIVIEPVSGYAGEVVNFTAQISYENGDPLNGGTATLIIKYDEKLAASVSSVLGADDSYSSKVSNGKADFNVKLGDPGTYPYAVTYSGDDTDPVEAESTLTISKLETTVSGDDVSGKPKETKDIAVTVLDKNNDPVANGIVTLTLDGKTYNATVENGNATFSVELPNPGTYDAAISYNGNDYYAPSESSISVNVEKVNTSVPSAEDVSGKAGDKIDISVEIVDENGNPVKNGTTTLTIDGKTYTAEVTDGVATFKDVVLPESDTVADVYYQGNDYYNASSTTLFIKITEDNNTDENQTKHVSSEIVDASATGNPIAMMLLALCAMVITYRKK